MPLVLINCTQYGADWYWILNFYIMAEYLDKHLEILKNYQISRVLNNMMRKYELRIRDITPYPSRTSGFSPNFCWDPCCSLVLCSVLCFFFSFFVFVLCLVYPMLPVALDSPYLIASPVFSNVYKGGRK